MSALLQEAQVTGPGARTVTWWSFNKPRRMEKDGNNHAEYWYGPGGDRAMFRQSARIAGQTVLTLYGGALYERRHAGGAATQHTHHIIGRTVATVHRSGTSTTRPEILRLTGSVSGRPSSREVRPLFVGREMHLAS